MQSLDESKTQVKGTTWAIGDIHGCFRALTTLIERVGIQPEDQVVTLGDYVDRGPDSRAVIEWLIDREKSGQVIPLIGNHEVMMLQATADSISQKSWESSYVGGSETLRSYGSEGSLGKLREIPEEHWVFIATRLKRYYATGRWIFAHASLDPLLDLEAQPEAALLWSIFEPQALHISGRPLICGHTEQRQGVPSVLAHGICIDTGAFRPNGWLTCLNVETGQYGQANQRGEFRTGELTVAPDILFQGPSGANS